MTKSARRFLAAAVAALGLVAPQGAAQAQYAMQGSYDAAYQPEPFYPYVVQPQVRSYAVAPPQAAPRAYPYVRSGSAPKVLKRVASKADPALIEELRHRRGGDPVITKNIIVRERPVVVEHQRVVDDPPVVVQRETVIDDERPRGLIRGRNDKAQAPVQAPVQVPVPAARPAAGQRVIRAEAEVTILGPDRMSIRLFRKRGELPPDEAGD